MTAEEARDSGRAAELLLAYPFAGEEWPGSDPAAWAAEVLRGLPADIRVHALEEDGRWHWLAAVAPLAFDTQVFGAPLARLAPLIHRRAWPEIGEAARGDALIRQALAEAAAMGIHGLTARVAGRDVLGAQALEAAGARLVDVSVEWLLDLAPGARAPETPAGLALRPWTESDRAGLMELAAGAMCDLDSYADRFAMDPRLRGGCPELYRRWVANSLAGEQADGVLVLAEGDLPVGFITLKLPGRGGAAAGCGWVALNVVHPAWRGRGLYNLLLARGLAWLAERGATRARVRTKASQHAVIRAWSRLGARQVLCDLSFHIWLE